MLGNDIVDYAIDEKRYTNPRFISRILNHKEQAYLAQADNPNCFLWSLWAAKEAAYKAVQRNNLTVIFSPLTFALTEQTLEQLIPADENRTLKGHIQFQDLILELKFNWPKPEVVHCLACIKAKTNHWPHIISQVDYRENLTTYQQQSEAVRLLAQNLLCQHMINASIIRPNLSMQDYSKAGPPILIDRSSGEALPHIISLSHDRNYLAVAVYLAT